MKAILFDRFGGTDVLHEADIEVPQPGPGQVRVRVRAAGLNALDGKIRSGAMEAAFPTPLPAVPGAELAGVVDALGEGVQDVQEGDEVLGWSDTGSYAQYALATTVAPKPAGLDWQHAVALPVASETAERVLDLLGVAAGETVLMHGAAGAVGTLAVQLATARGARVIATAGPANQDYLTSLGATATLYGEGLVERVRALSPKGVDAVFDLAGKGALEDSITLRGGTERIVTIADFRAHQLGITFSSGGQERSAARLAALAQDAATGKLVTTVNAYPLDQAAKVQQISDAGHVRGKLVLTLD
ncbi:NADP-dependent oxidoreductase [Streptomyces caniscabiei]|uniref:NADP-dependent oxidoreductase n=1 Tax=Streptomyces caniscabiei TaxID=2746961 RepID=A0A927QK96_9ACTN|nr:NADP-dependent oxidoreductase [Streptomyces caniscabiei]MBD9723644.1 NADP-dependent oxidoreductase [Streptomyces caniscabiei]MDX3511130.1 NADP-dependent oxidoreductase [Streptomyces caniscabiei]MDX3721210.1 NADP-dependent oxidoreductase [Streptomyces caniscabiei]WEO27207.1 NADP-dependent oxidoreductase [Streptomyces caniscabiei]